MSKIAHGLILLSFPIGTFGLGSWQVYRRNWKLDLIEKLKLKLDCDPIDLIENLDSINDLEYRRVTVLGTFDHSKEMLMGPRTLLMNGETSSTSGLITSQGKSGFNVITPFVLLDKNITILVNRGWVPRSLKQSSTRQEGQRQGSVKLTGIIRLNDNSSSSQFATKSSDIYLFRDLKRMSKEAATDPIFIDAIESERGGPFGSQTRITMRNEHLSYIITWFSISLVSSYLWMKKYGKIFVR